MNKFEEYKDIHNKKDWIELKGFTSTSLVKEEALKFMFRGLSLEEIPVLYQISNLCERGESYFKLDNEDYSLFPYEKEVLLDTHSKFTIIDI